MRTAYSGRAAAYEKMGAPRYPSQAQIRELRQATQLPPPETRPIERGELTLTMPEHGLALIDHLPGFDRQKHDLADALDRASRAGQVAELHNLAEIIRFRYGLSPPPAEEG